MKFRADQLSGEHIGRRVTLTTDGAEVAGILAGINHEADLITNQSLCEAEPTLMPGHVTLRIQVGYMTVIVEPDQMVTLRA